MSDGPPAEPRERSLAPALAAAALTIACLAGLGAGCFGGVLFHNRQFAFRDAGHYYYPLYQRVQQEWDAGRWPLWCPELNGGTPLLGNPTAAVLYPGKVVFFLLPYPWAMRVYIIGHVYLAAGSMWLLLRSWRVSATGSSLAALAYAFGAPVLSLTSNVIFLVGAAWAPLGFLFADRWLRLGRRGALAGLAVVLGLEFLGGDPEAAYVTVACALGYALGLAAAREPSIAARCLRRGVAVLVPVAVVLFGLELWSAHARMIAATAEPGAPAPWRPPTRLIVLAGWVALGVLVVRRARKQGDPRRLVIMTAGVIGAATLALALTGAQLVPVLETAAQGIRAGGAATSDVHDVYPFSVHPLLVAGSVWPDFYGTTDRGSRSWSQGLPPKYEHNRWMRSLYLGGLTLVLASAAAGFRGGPAWRAWLTGVALATLLAALGAYGSPLLWARCVPQWSAALGPLDAPVVARIRADGFPQDGDGGFYWLFVSALPGFATFRYPAKLLVFTALAVSGLAGAGWDLVAGASAQRARRVAWVLVGLSLAGLVGSYLGAGIIRRSLEGVAVDRVWLYGPLDVTGAMADLRTSLLRGVLVYLAAAALIAVRGGRPRVAAAAALAIMAADLGLANARHALTAPQAAFEGTPRTLALIQAAEVAPGGSSPTPFRVLRAGTWWPARWDEGGGSDRVAELTTWERDRLWSHHPLPLGIRIPCELDTTLTIDHGSMLLPFALRLNEELARRIGQQPGAMMHYYPRKAYDMWATRYFIVPGNFAWDSTDRAYVSLVPQTTQIYPAPDAFSGPGGAERRGEWERSDDFRVLRNDAAFPFAWVVHRARLIPPIDRSDTAAQQKLIEEIVYPNNDFWNVPGKPVRDPHLQAWVETDRPAEVEALLSRAVPQPGETVTVTHDSPQRLELTAVLHSPGLAVVAEAYYPGWTLTVDGAPATILRVNRAMRGVALRAGTHQLVFAYRPLSFRLGIAFSALGLTALAGAGVWQGRSVLRNARRENASGRTEQT